MEVLGMTLSKKGEVDPAFWSGKRIFLTGHTGFKGGWLSLWLSSMGARVTGYALAPNTSPNFYEVADIQEAVEESHIADIRNLDHLRAAMTAANPDIVIHMAAQPLVRYSYINPIETYATNVMGTAHLLECVRGLESVRATVVVTTDKCYENKEWVWGYRENEPMGGHDPYSSSTACSELVSAAYRQSFLNEAQIAMATARAGNVIGGGDWASERLVPDILRSMQNNQSEAIRNPGAY
jgi:CDP-glucose 4,6-dehydratase